MTDKKNSKINLGNLYEYKKGIYRVSCFVRMKHPTSRQWVDAVVYWRSDIRTGDVYVREISDFEKKFKWVGVE